MVVTCMAYESLVSMVNFFIYAIMYILLYYKLDLLIRFYFYVCIWKLSSWNVKNKLRKKHPFK
jgi:hypothetical protein